MPQWATFLGIAGVVLVLLLVLSHLTQSTFADGEREPGGETETRTGGTESTGRHDTETDANSVDVAVELPPRNRDSDRDPFSKTGPNPPDSTDRDSKGSARVGDRSPSQRGTSGAGDTVDGVGPGPDRNADSNRARDPLAPNGDHHRPSGRGGGPESLSTELILLNVALSQGLFALVLLGAAVFTAIPAAALGIEFSTAYLESGLVLGTVAGGTFYVANELGAAAATWAGFDHDEGLRELLAPDSIHGWLLLLFGILPIIAVFEEFLFRAALIGVPVAGFGVSPWLLAVVSSVAFAIGHGMQGSVGVIVTGLLGFVLAAAFIATESLLVVVVAHYLVNALEFIVHEGLGIEWADTLEG
ncbi:CPBP family intramembrane glutamic endopeptidase [Natrinema halophilum]|uniref:CPBP family intramembrane metalloprotease n=1 Tax=Natrinema halophilum TaxID=1699371 RepID=A0A7D5KEK9_9EURY|nr:CPBP family intramembrane glutamic endopeptidase [Natrinema halophilum]QLG50296.1 CPBP family intramembrane metalloprotease [Natrinema halophilum]